MSPPYLPTSVSGVTTIGFSGRRSASGGSLPASTSAFSIGASPVAAAANADRNSSRACDQSRGRHTEEKSSRDRIHGSDIPLLPSASSDHCRPSFALVWAALPVHHLRLKCRIQNQDGVVGRAATLWTLVCDPSFVKDPDFTQPIFPKSRGPLNLKNHGRLLSLLSKFAKVLSCGMTIGDSPGEGGVRSQAECRTTQLLRSGRITPRPTVRRSATQVLLRRCWRTMNRQPLANAIHDDRCRIARNCCLPDAIQ